MKQINQKLINEYKFKLLETISREMMPEPSIEPEPPIDFGDVNRGIRSLTDRVKRFIQYERIPAVGLPSWLRDLFLRGLITQDDLRGLYRDSNGNYYFQEGGENGILRRIIQDPSNPNGWSYDPDSPPIGPLSKKPWERGTLQQYFPNQVGNGGWGGWGKATNPMWQYGVGGGVALPLMLQDPLQEFPDSDGDGIPDYIDNDGSYYM